MSAVTALKLCFETLLSTRPILQGNGMEGAEMNMHWDLLEHCWEALTNFLYCALGTGILVIMVETSLMTSMQRSGVFFLNFQK